MRIIAVIADVVMAGICGRKRVGFLKWLGEARRFQIQAKPVVPALSSDIPSHGPRRPSEYS